MSPGGGGGTSRFLGENVQLLFVLCIEKAFAESLQDPYQ